GDRDCDEARLRRHPDPDRPAWRRQDVAGRVGGPGARPEVWTHLPWRHPRRGRDSRTPPDLRWRAAGEGRTGLEGRWQEKPGVDARRDWQSRRRLEGGSVERAAGGARSRTKPNL